MLLILLSRCLDCKKSFSQAANLTAHVRTHTGQKVTKQTVIKSSLFNSNFIHPQPFRCPICDRRFSQSSSVTTHMR